MVMPIDLAIVGAGPAGLAAALTASEHGLRVAVIDEQPRIGGQIFRQPPAAFGNAAAQEAHMPTGYRWGASLLNRAEHSTDITWLLGTSALGVFFDRDGEDTGPDGIRATEATTRLAITSDKGMETLHVRRLLIATGAYDLPVAFPGWTLPGVMTAGAVQTLLKSQKLCAADRFVLAGAHPLLFVVADLLRRAGADIAEVAFARSIPGPREMIRSLAAVPGHVRMLAEMSMSIGNLIRSGIPVRTRAIVQRAIGANAVTAVDLAPVDESWRVVGPSRRVSTGMVVVGYGFAPSTELARQAGCALRWDSAGGGWVVRHDALMRTNVPGIFVAGEPGGVAGAEQAEAEGRLAAIAIAYSLGAVASKTNLVAVRRAVDKAKRFSAVVQELFEPRRDALVRLAVGDTPVCRCELVSRAEVDRTLHDNPQMRSINALKLACRVGMGPCQGRYCELTAAATVAGERGMPMSDVGSFTGRFPLRPVPLATLAGMDGL